MTAADVCLSLLFPKIQYLLDQLHADLHENALIFSDIEVSDVIPLAAAKFDTNLQG